MKVLHVELELVLMKNTTLLQPQTTLLLRFIFLMLMKIIQSLDYLEKDLVGTKEIKENKNNTTLPEENLYTPFTRNTKQDEWDLSEETLENELNQLKKNKNKL